MNAQRILWDFGRPLIQERFETFHAEHPEVYAELVALARKVKARGFDRYGIATLFEVVRYHRAVNAERDEGFKLNNDFRSRYARLIMSREDDLAEFFETRELRA